MSLPELTYALKVGARPANTDGRAKYGMGLKTSACWLGNVWTVRTKRLGESVEHHVTVDVEAVADGTAELPYTETPVDQDLHYTVVEISALNRPFHGRTKGKIRDFLSSMYRQDIRQGLMTLRWQGETLRWDDSEEQFLQAPDGSRYRKDYSFTVNGKEVTGWVGVLDRGSRAKAGFSILHAGRVVRGWPDSWRPESIFGQSQGSNDLVNQRITGEIHLDAFDVTHTKDNILWLGDEEDEVQRQLRAECLDYIVVAKTRRRSADDERGPSDVEIQTAVEELNQELTSAELVDLISVEEIPPPEVVAASVRPVLQSVGDRAPVFGGLVGQVDVKGYLSNDLSSNDPYVVVDSTTAGRVSVVVNLSHPFLEQLSGSEGMLNYLRQCTYDAIAEWQARHKAASLDPDTIKLLKDRLMRLPGQIEMRLPSMEDELVTLAAVAEESAEYSDN